MPVPGPDPKAANEKRFRGAPTHEWVEVVRVPFEDGPELAEFRSDGRRWPERTKAKWDAWRAMPHCKLWAAAEWDFALDSIEIAACVHDGGAASFATELRNREKVLGTTVDFLRALRIRYVEPQPDNDTAAGVTNLADYRNL